MTQYRESIAVVSLRGARANIAPRIWKQATSITLTHGTTTVVVALKRVSGEYGCITRERVFFVCPCCTGLAGSLAFGCDATQPVTCRKCGRWRSREYRVVKKAPHVRNVAATGDEHRSP